MVVVVLVVVAIGVTVTISTDPQSANLCANPPCPRVGVRETGIGPCDRGRVATSGTVLRAGGATVR